MNGSLNPLEFWQQLSLTQKTGLVTAVVILGVVAAVLVGKLTEPSYKSLYSNLTAEDANAIVLKLKEQKIAYQLSDDGTTVKVPMQHFDDLRLELAGEGLPQGGNVGFELFESPRLGQSEYSEGINYTRAMQGELARTIARLAAVQAVRVHLVMPKERLYMSEEQKPTASVFLTLRRQELTPREVKAITHLVSSAVEGLAPENVTIVDSNGRLLSDLAQFGDDGVGMVRMQAQRKAEMQIEQRVQSMLDRVLGPGKSIAQVSVQMNFDQKEIDREQFTPVGDGSTVGVLENQHTTEESYSGTRPTGAAGTPGVTTNALSAGGNGGNGNNYKHTETTSQYRVSKMTEHVKVLPGEISRISLGLLVDESIDDTVLESLAKTLTATAGITVDRDPAIAVDKVKFDTSAQKTAEAQAKKAAQEATFNGWLKTAGAAGLLIAFLLVMFFIYRATLAPVTAQIMPVDEEPPSAAFELLPPANQAIESYTAAALALEEPVDAEEAASVEQTLSKLDPQRIAQVIKSLLSEEA